jgi:cell division transport system permease protein
MLWTNIKRVVRTGFVSFWRNGYVSLASIVVMIVTLFVISSIMFSSALLGTALDKIKEKVDINVYFLNDAQEADILALEKRLEALPEVAGVTYISREQALEAFRNENQTDQVILGALEELGDNPLGAVLNVMAKETSQYESIAAFLQSEQDASANQIIRKVTYFENQKEINVLTQMIESGRKLGAIVTVAFVLLSILITFNTIRLAIFVSRDEISVMKLVGASYMYIRGPFVVGGMMYGIFAGLITLMFLYPITYWLGPITARLFDGINLFAIYVSNFSYYFCVLIGSGILIGAVSSYLAVRKYLAK